MTETHEISAEFPYKFNTLEVLGSKIHYVDEGSGAPILFLHGNPTSSYLWRNIIPHLTSMGRCIAPDLIGMGKSDKPEIEYRFFDHARYVEAFIEELELKQMTLVIHDWGSAVGFHYAMQHQEKIKAISFMEAILAPTPSWDMFPENLRELFKAFRTKDVGWNLIVNKNIFIEQLLPGGVVRELTAAEMAHYRAPYQDPSSRKPLWRWPNEVPIEGEPADVAEAVAAYNAWLQQSDVPKLMFYVTPGAICPAPMVEWCKHHLKNLQTVDLGQGIHFLQEDHPHRIGEELARWYGSL